VGKYSSLRGRLPEFQEETSYQAKVNEEKQRILGNAENPEDANVAALARQYAGQRKKKEDLEILIKAVNLAIAAYEQIIVDRMQTDGQQSLTLTGGATIYLQDDIYPAVEDRPASIKWAISTGQEAILSIHPMTLKGIAKECLEQGQDLPPGVKAYLRTSLRYRGLMKGATP
jgi:hypothetical protein